MPIVRMSFEDIVLKSAARLRQKIYEKRGVVETRNVSRFVPDKYRLSGGYSTTPTKRHTSDLCAAVGKINAE